MGYGGIILSTGDELPEWATDDMAGGDEGGTFDASGAFLSLKDMEDPSDQKTNNETKDPSKDNASQSAAQTVSNALRMSFE